ncbi:MAG TPA: D-TA family PLP-dependent enzyme [Roseiflexaceae bacterium]|nr:D-TA family PLP-dependent enzyme [Roseiflexaceae bacterium]
MHVDELETPQAVVDLERLEANIARLQAYLDEHHIANRPHIKTHKIPEIAHMQLAAGAVGVTCQKLGEAEVMAQAGVKDILITYNLLGAARLERLARLCRRARVSVTADSAVTVRGLSRAMSAAGLELEVLVECDTGGGRCGVQSPEEAAQLARLIAASPGLRFGGLMTYPNSPGTDPFVRAAKELLAADGIAVARVSGGGSPVMWQAHECREITEHRAGTYVYGDRKMVAVGAMRLEECALSVVCTVVSRPTATRGILDGGSKAFSSDTLGLEGYGLILEYPAARIYGQSEEHGHVDFSACARAPEVGERVTVIPNHACVVSNLFNQVVGARRGAVEVVWPVAARGALH